MRSSNVNFEFPVLGFNDRAVIAYETRDQLETSTSKVAENHYLDGSWLVDSTGRSWNVLSMIEVKKGKRRSGWSMFLIHAIRVDLDLAEGEQFDLKKLEESVFEVLDRNFYGWDDPNEKKLYLTQANDVSSFIERASRMFRWQRP
jgi:hypothetical protein